MHMHGEGQEREHSVNIRRPVTPTFSYIYMRERRLRSDRCTPRCKSLHSPYQCRAHSHLIHLPSGTYEGSWISERQSGYFGVPSRTPSQTSIRFRCKFHLPAQATTRRFHKRNTARNCRACCGCPGSLPLHSAAFTGPNGPDGLIHTPRHPRRKAMLLNLVK